MRCPAGHRPAAPTVLATLPSRTWETASADSSAGFLEPAAYLRTINAQGHKQLGGGIGAITSQECQQEMACLDVRRLSTTRLVDGALEDCPRTGGERRKPACKSRCRRVADVGDVDADGGQSGSVERIRGGPGGLKVDPESLSHVGVDVMQKPEQKVIGAQAPITASPRLLRG